MKCSQKKCRRFAPLIWAVSDISYCTVPLLLIRGKSMLDYIVCLLVFLLSTFKCCYFSYVTGHKYSPFSVTVRGKAASIKTTRKNVEDLLVKQIVLQTPIQIPWELRAFQFSAKPLGLGGSCTAQSWRCAGSYIWSAGKCQGK